MNMSCGSKENGMPISKFCDPARLAESCEDLRVTDSSSPYSGDFCSYRSLDLVSSGSPASYASLRTSLITFWTSVANAGYCCSISSCSILSAKPTITVLIFSTTPSSRFSLCTLAASAACLRFRNCCCASLFRSRRLLTCYSRAY